MKCWIPVLYFRQRKERITVFKLYSVLYLDFKSLSSIPNGSLICMGERQCGWSLLSSSKGIWPAVKSVTLQYGTGSHCSCRREYYLSNLGPSTLAFCLYVSLSLTDGSSISIYGPDHEDKDNMRFFY